MKLPIALQLYTVRNEMTSDFEGTLKKIKEIGYDGVEFAGGLRGRDPEHVKKLCEELELIPVSAHIAYVDLLERAEELITAYKIIGVKQIVVPYLLPELRPGTDKFPSVIEGVRKIAEVCKKCGLTLAYHNHDFEFEKIDGEYAIDKLYREIPEDLLKTQFDTCWVKVAGEDPAAYLRKYAGRTPTVHMKDFKGVRNNNMYALIGIDDDKKQEPNEKFQLMPCGYGKQDMNAIYEAALDSGAEWLIVEQDSIEPGKTAFESVEQSLKYLRTL